MKAKSISHCQGKGSLAHNNRKFRPKNVDTARIKDNVTFVKQSIKEAYEYCFDDAVKRYNEKQKRNDRKISTTYFKYAFDCDYKDTVITAADKRKSFYETLVQIGDMFDTNCKDFDNSINEIDCLTEYAVGFQKRNKNFYVFNLVLHLDEQTPHLHIDYIPVSHHKRGLDTQNGMAKALEEMGFGTGENAVNKWRLAERKVLEDLCRKRRIEVKPPEKGRGHSYTVDEYKEKEALKAEVAAVKVELAEVQSQLDRVYKDLDKAKDIRHEYDELRLKSNGLENLITHQKKELAVLEAREPAAIQRALEREKERVEREKQYEIEKKKQLKQEKKEAATPLFNFGKKKKKITAEKETVLTQEPEKRDYSKINQIIDFQGDVIDVSGMHLDEKKRYILHNERMMKLQEEKAKEAKLKGENPAPELQREVYQPVVYTHTKGGLKR